ncbi:MAG: mechanosensitive ion channel, partial [Erysipelotrichaceae bacterium]
IVIKVLTHIISLKHLKNEKLIDRFIKITIMSIVCYSSLQLVIPLQKIAVQLLASGGVLAIVIGFAAQSALGEVASGVLLLFTKPFKIGDLVKIPSENLIGTILDVSIVHTTLRTFENTKIVIPNSIMNKSIVENISQTGAKKLNFLFIEVANDTNIELAMKIIKKNVIEHPNYMNPNNDKKKDKTVDIKLVDFKEGAIVLRTSVYSKNNDEGFNTLSDLRINIKNEFDKNHITIPCPHRVVSINK